MTYLAFGVSKDVCCSEGRIKKGSKTKRAKVENRVEIGLLQRQLENIGSASEIIDQ